MDGGPSFCQYHIVYLIICNTFMALYAVDDDDLIFAAHAEAGKTYWCLDCFGPVKRRLGRQRFPHFFHTQPAPSCRLYSKTEDHLLAQLQLQRHFPPGALQIERPFLNISRVADLCWENEKIVFEVQCSPLSETEAQKRTEDYRSQGYEAVWLLDDKRYNGRILRPAEAYLRRQATYYLRLKPGLFSEYYDQFEVFSEGRRTKKGRKLPIDLQKVRRKFPIQKETFPQQIVQMGSPIYFLGDRFHRAASYPLARQNWRALESQLQEKVVRAPSRWKRWLRRMIAFLSRRVR